MLANQERHDSTNFQALSAVQLEEAPKSSADTTRALVPVRSRGHRLRWPQGTRALVVTWLGDDADGN